MLIMQYTMSAPKFEKKDSIKIHYTEEFVVLKLILK